MFTRRRTRVSEPETRRRTRVSEPEANSSVTRPSRSPARSRKISPSQESPRARQIAPKSKSPSRKSPSRKYPARKSPARTVKEVIEPTVPQVTVPRSPAKRLALQPSSTENISLYRSTRSKRIDYSVFSQIGASLEKNGMSEEYIDRHSVDEVSHTPRRSSRLQEYLVIPSLPDIRRSVSKSSSKQSRTPSKSVSKSLENYSDEEKSSDESYREKPLLMSTQSNRKLSTPLRTSIGNVTQIARELEFGGSIGTAAFMILIPLSVISILTSCMKSCSIHTILNFTPFKSLALWFSESASTLILGQILIQAVMAIFPYFGPKTDSMDDTGKKHCFNAFLSSIVVTMLVYVLNYMQYINKDLILLEYLRLATASYIFAVVLSIVLYLKSRKLEKEDVNQYANTGYFFYDFFLGRELHPSIKSIDVKIWISRISNINTLILSLLIFTNAFKTDWPSTEDISLASITHVIGEVNIQISNPTVLVFSAMQIAYILYFIVREYSVTSTFYWQSEGVGYLQTVSSALYPFYFTTLSKHISDTGLTLSTNVLALASLLYLLGYYLMLVSNDIKYEFRRDPLQLSLAKLESMMTFNGKRIITSHVWGTLRHPNYAGDILIHIVLSLPGLLSGQVIAASPALITILVLLYRAWRDDVRCRRRYGSAWTRYCKKVPSVIIPKVF